MFIARTFSVVLATASLLLAISHRLDAQAVYGSIVGTVVDPSGGAVTGAKVIVTDTGRDVANTTATNESGNFTQRYLIAGTYRVRIEAPGFQAYQQDNVSVSVDSETRIEARLQVGDVSQTVEVSAEASLLKTERSDVASTWSGKTVTNLPILGRRFTTFQLLTPGIVPQPTSLTAASAENPQGSYRMLVNGQSFAGTSHLLDGTDNHDAVLGWIVINPTLESVTEAKVTTANYDAEFGTASAGVVSAQTKSGTNQFHGSAFEYLRNDHIQARNPFTQAAAIYGSNGRLIPITQWNQFGGSLGGPIKHNKLFVFGDYQGTRRNIGGSVLLRVPSAAERMGDLSALGVDVYDPQSSTTLAGRTQFLGNRIPTSRLSSQSQKLLALVPLPNVAATLDQPNYAGSGSVKSNDDQVNTRVDHYLNEKIHLFGRYSLAQFKTTAPGAFGLAVGPGFEPGGGTSAFAGVSDSRNHSIAAGFDYSVHPTLLTDFRFGYFRYKVFVTPQTLGTNPATALGIPGLNNNDFTSDMPAFFVNGYGNALFRTGSALGVNGCNCPLDQNENQFQFVNNWTKIEGNHTFKFGADIRRAHNLRVPSDQHRSGQLSFNAERTQGPNGGGSGMAGLLLGDVSSFQRYVSDVTDARETQNRWFFFGQDTWRINSKLTLNYGVRWEIYRPQTVNGAGKGGFVDLNTGEVLVAGSQGVGLDLNVQGSLTNIAPRFGIAYQATPKTVVRTGYGRGYDLGVFGSVFGHNVTQNLPVLGIQTLNPTNNFDAVFTLDKGPVALSPSAILNSQPKGPNGRPLLPNGVTPFALPNRLRLPTVDAWNFSVQRQIGSGMSLEVAYVGNKGTHVFAGDGGDYDPNQPSLQGFGTLTTNQRRPFFQKFGWSQSLRYYGSDASNNYNGLQTKLEKRFANGFSVLSHYTWSKTLNYTNTYFNQDARLAYGISNNSREHVFLLTSLYELPFGKGKKFLSNASRFTDAFLGGWQVNGIFSWMSGLTFTPTYRDCNSDRDTGWCRPDLVGDYSVDSPGQYGWFATTGANNPLLANGQTIGPWRRPQKGQFGSVGRNRLTGPNFSQMDTSFFKTFPITEKLNAQFRAEIFNLPNHTNLGQPNTCVDCPGTAGRIFATFQQYLPRQAQLAVRFEF